MLNKSILVRHLTAKVCRYEWSVMCGQHQKRYINQKYDKVVKLFPPKTEYKYKDSKFFNEHHLEDEPYLQRTDDEIYELTRAKLEKDYPDRHWTQVDMNEEPFRQVLVGNPDEKGFTETETIADQKMWFWVQRLLPKNESTNTDGDYDADGRPIVKPSGFVAAPKTKPDVEYFIPRTRTKLLPVYRKYQIEGRNPKEYWKNRWDGLFNSYHKDLLERLDEIKFENNETTLVLTLITQIKGDIWRFEEDIRGEMERKHQKRILSAVNEPNGVLTLKGDFVMDCVKWLIDKGF